VDGSIEAGGQGCESVGRRFHEAEIEGDEGDIAEEGEAVLEDLVREPCGEKQGGGCRQGEEPELSHGKGFYTQFRREG